jgi:hypothetical protein
MRIGGELVALDGEVDRGADAFAVQRLDLFAGQVQTLLQARMARRMLGVEVEVAVVALGKDGHGVDVGPLHGPGEFAGVEVGADIRDPGTGVEVEVNLTLTGGMDHGCSLVDGRTS